MKLYKSFVALSLMAMAMMGCSTEDLEKDINTLKDRVTDMEAQVQKLNDNMNVLRIALDGNKTIQKVTENGDGSFSLLLSDGSTIALTEGVDGSVYYPIVSVDGEGYWLIDGVKQNVKAQAENGQDGVTPKFKLVAEGNKNYWQVSYDNGATYDFLLDANKQKVQANAETGIVPSTDGPISEVNVEQGLLSFKCGEQSYSIPIIEGLVCEVVDTEAQKDGDYLLVPTQGKLELPATITCDEMIFDASGDFELVYNDKTQKLEISIEPETPGDVPEGITGTIIIQANKGLGWSVTTLKVKTKYVVTSYLTEFNKGKKLNFGGILIDKTSGIPVANGGKVHVDGDVITGEGIHFIKGGANVSIDKSFGAPNIILISDTPNQKANVTLKGTNYMTLKKDEGKATHLVFKNINLSGEPNVAKYFFTVEDNNDNANVVIEDCVINLYGKPLSYANVNGLVFKKVCMRNTAIYMVGGGAQHIFNMPKATMNDVVIENNLLAVTVNTEVKGSLLIAKQLSCKVNNNTFHNYVASNGFIVGKLVGYSDTEGWSCKNNIFSYTNKVIQPFLIKASAESVYGSKEAPFYTPNICSDGSVNVGLFHAGGQKPDWEQGTIVEKATEPVLQLPSDLNSPLYLSLKEGFGYDPEEDTPVLAD